MARRGAWLVVLDVVAGRPSVPDAWTLTAESGGWYTARRSGVEVALHDSARLADGRALCVLAGPAAVVAAIATAAPDRLRHLGALASAPLAVRRRWRWWRLSGTEDGAPVSHVVRELPVPLTALPMTVGDLVVADLHAPVFPRTVAGWQDNDDAEDGGA